MFKLQMKQSDVRPCSPPSDSFLTHYVQTLRVMYPYMPQNEDELELVPGDFVFMSPVDQTGTSEGWVYGTSLTTGLSGLLPENYVNLADESDTWVFHGWADQMVQSCQVI